MHNTGTIYGADYVGAGIGATGGSAFASPVTTTNDKLTFNQDDGVSAKLGLFYTAPVAFLPLDLTAQGSAFYFDVLTIDTSFWYNFTNFFKSGNYIQDVKPNRYLTVQEYCLDISLQGNYSCVYANYSGYT